MSTSAVLRFSTFDVTKQVFYRSSLSMGLVNLKPIVDNHVLVVPQRATPRLADLTPAEIKDLFESVQRIGDRIEKATSAKSLTVACQDGPFAGQSVPHVHIHVLPRRPGDFEPLDKVYDHLNEVRIEKDLTMAGGIDKLKIDADRQPRTADDMHREASYLSTLFPEYAP